jgi:HD-GYP domain-containing protein (c-di-GMP phosphodiesterase class II)
MADTRTLLSKIAALRQRLEQAQGLANDAGSELTSLVETGVNRTEQAPTLEQQVRAVSRFDALFDTSLRQVTATTAPAPNGTIWPKQLTARARRLLVRGRELLGRLRSVADDFLSSSADDDPLAGLFREALAMVESGLRLVQVFPDTPSVQLHLCEGLEATLDLVSERLGLLTGVLGHRRAETACINTLAELLKRVEAGSVADLQPFVGLAEEVLAEARQAAPLRFAHAGPEDPARFVACHALTVARVIARLARHESAFHARPLEPVLAGFLHDVGMLRVPVEVLAQPSPLNLDQRRVVESHVRVGIELVSRLTPGGDWLIGATAGHHERPDGTGYPNGVREAHVGHLTRLLAVCDVYASLCTPRPHRPARDTRTALTDTLLLAEQGGLDRHHAERLLQLSFYPVGSVVELADGSVGVVIATHTGLRDFNLPARPVVAQLIDARGEIVPVSRYLDLAQCDGHSIVRSLPANKRRDLLGKRYPEFV